MCDEKKVKYLEKRMWELMVAVTTLMVIVTVLVCGWVWILLNWQAVCEKIAVTALEGGLEKVTQEAVTYEQPPARPAAREQRSWPVAEWEKGVGCDRLNRQAQPSLFLETSEWKVVEILRRQAIDKARGYEFDYVVIYKYPNGAQERVGISGKPLSTETIHQEIERLEKAMSDALAVSPGKGGAAQAGGD